MAHFYPFHALMPTPKKVAEVAAVPYDVVNSEEAAVLAEGNPLSFLRVSRPEIEMAPGVDLYSDEVYAKAEANFKPMTGRPVMKQSDFSKKKVCPFVKLNG